MDRIRLARRGDGRAVESLAALALGGDVAETALAPALGSLAAAIDGGGGLIWLRHGQGLVFVACPAADSGHVLGMLYTCPPIRFIDDCADRGEKVQQRLAQAVAEVELLAVTSRARRRGVGSALLAAAEDTVRHRGGKLVYVKVRHDGPVLQWYRTRGYQPLPPGEPVILAVAGTKVGFADSGDGFRVIIKAISGSHAQRR
jgi:GNAT superfamily N-acetyltransferase